MKPPRASTSFRLLASADVASVLAATPLFNVLDAPALEELAQQVERVHVVGGETLMREGEIGDCLYIVAGGRLAVVVEGPGGVEVAVAEVGRGETVGEMALLSGSPRSATVRAIRDSMLLRFSKASFDLMLERHARTTVQLARLIVLRLEQSIHGRRGAISAPATIAIAPGGTNAPVSLVATLLAERLSHQGRTIHLTSQRLIEFLGVAGSHAGSESRADLTATGIFAGRADDDSIVAWLDRQEAENDFVIYECDAGFTSWTARCLRQADRIVLAARAADAATHSIVERRLFETQAQRRRASVELILVHAADSRLPVGADVWLADRPVAAHHHVREGNSRDFDRLGRLLLGNGVGVVLSGGGARGFAHLGVLRALEECDVPIDRVGGTSMGAIIGGLAACGYTHDERMARARHAFSEHPPDKDYTLPIVAINHGGRSNTMLRSLYGDVLIENLWTPFFCVCTNLTSAETRVAREGPLWKWVRASSSPPGLAPPIFDDGQLFADGGILDNLPVGVMRGLSGIGLTVASDVGANSHAARNLPAWDGVSGWAVLWQRLRGGGKTGPGMPSGVPSLAEILMLTSTINSVPAGVEARRLADLYLNPPSPDVKFTEWKAIDRIVEAGYRYAIERVEQWRAQT